MFPSRFKQTFTFQPFKLFRCSFQDILICSLCFGLPVLVRRILHWQMPGQKISMRVCLYIKQFGVACSAIHITNHCYQWLPEYILCAETVWCPCGKVICRSQKYTRDHWVMQRETLSFNAIILYSSTEH